LLEASSRSLGREDGVPGTGGDGEYDEARTFSCHGNAYKRRKIPRGSFRPRMVHVPKLVAPLPYLTIRRKNPIHRALGTEIPTFVEKRCVDFRGRHVDEARIVEHLEHLAALIDCESSRRRSTPCRRDAWRAAAIVRCASHCEHCARRRDANPWREERHARHEELPPVSSSGLVGSVTPKSCETFF
jgi:hypothetical protein